MHKLVEWSLFVSATPSGMGSMDTMLTRRDLSGVMQTLEPESAIGRAGETQSWAVCGADGRPNIAIGMLCNGAGGGNATSKRSSKSNVLTRLISNGAPGAIRGIVQSIGTDCEAGWPSVVQEADEYQELMHAEWTGSMQTRFSSARGWEGGP